jgi:predicted  nucleic acid-binding Zn-ribbon protein
MPWQDRINLMRNMYHDKYNKEYDQKVQLKSEGLTPLDFKTPNALERHIKAIEHGEVDEDHLKKQQHLEEHKHNSHRSDGFKRKADAADAQESFKKQIQSLKIMQAKMTKFVIKDNNKVLFQSEEDGKFLIEVEELLEVVQQIGTNLALNEEERIAESKKEEVLLKDTTQTGKNKLQLVQSLRTNRLAKFRSLKSI